MQSTHNLKVWHRAVAFAGHVAALAQRLPRHAIPGMRSQLARAAVSIPANIAAGSGQASPAQYAHYVSVAAGSCSEVESHLLLVAQLVPEERGVPSLLAEVVELRRMLWGLRRYLNALAEGAGRRPPRSRPHSHGAPGATGQQAARSQSASQSQSESGTEASRSAGRREG